MMPFKQDYGKVINTLYFPLLILCIFSLLPWTKFYLARIGSRWLHIMISSFLISFSLTPIFRHIAVILKILDIPDSRKLHREPTPLLGGASLLIGFYIALFINGIFCPELCIIMVVSFIIFLSGLIDDIRGLSASTKLIIQILGCIILILSGITLRVVPIFLGLFSTISNAIITIIWIVGITNAMNFFDGMDGLAGGLGIILSFFLGYVAFETSQPFLGWISVSMLGACAGFLPFNFMWKRNASIFLGDSGSTFIGFTLATIAVYGHWSETSAVVSLVSPILIFWVLIFDMVHITVERILSGKVKSFKEWIDYVGKDHLHHRLARALGGNKNAVIFIYSLTICLGINSMVLRGATSFEALLLIIQSMLIVLIVTILERKANGSVN